VQKETDLGRPPCTNRQSCQVDNSSRALYTVLPLRFFCNHNTWEVLGWRRTLSRTRWVR